MHGRAEIRAFYTRFSSAFPDLAVNRDDGPFLHPHAPHTFVDWLGTGTHTGPLDPPGLLPTGKPIQRGTPGRRWKSATNALDRIGQAFDTAGFMRQLGMLLAQHGLAAYLSRGSGNSTAPRRGLRSHRKHGAATPNTGSFASHHSSATSPLMRSGVPTCSSSSTPSPSGHGRKSRHSGFFAQSTTATSTRTSSTKSPPTSTDSTQPQRSNQRPPDKNRTERTNHGVHRPYSCSSERVVPAGIEPATFRV